MVLLDSDLFLCVSHFRFESFCDKAIVIIGFYAHKPVLSPKSCAIVEHRVGV